MVGVTFVCCGLTGANDPMAFAKSNAPAMIGGMLVTMVLFMMR
jgi:hypothetical protein